MARNTISFNDFVTDYIGSRVEGSYDQYADPQQVRIHAKRVFRELQLTSMRVIKSLQLPVNTNNYTVTLPNDFVEYTKIGVLTNECQVIDLSPNNDLSLAENIVISNGEQVLDANGVPTSTPITECTGVVDYTAQGRDYGMIFYGYQRNGQVGRLFGLGGGNNRYGYYRFDYDKNRIALDPSFAYENIILEYISDGSLLDNPNIPVDAEDAMYKGTYYYIINRLSSVPESAKQGALLEYKRAVAKAKSRRNQPTKSEILSSIYRNFMLAPKFGQ